MITLISRWFKGASEQAAPQSQKVKATQTSKTHKVHGDVVSMEMPYGPKLIEAARSAQTKGRNSARQRIAQLLDKNELSLEQLQADSNDTQDLLALCSFNQSASEKILDTIADQAQLAEIANNSATPGQRKAAAERVTERAALEAMLKQSKGHDKNIYRIAKDGLSIFKEEDKALEEKRDYLRSLCVDAERHAKKPFDQLYSHKFVTLEKNWQSEEQNATPELQQRFEAAIAKCQAVIDQELSKSKAAALAEQQREASVNRLGALLEQMSAIASKICDTETLTGEMISVTQQDLASLTKQAHALLSDSESPSPAMVQAHAMCVKTSENISRLIGEVQAYGTLSSIQKSLAASTNEPSTDGYSGENFREQLLSQLTVIRKIPGINSEAAKQVETAISEWEQTQKQQKADRKAALDAIGDLSRRANIAARNGQVRRARGIYKELEEKRAQVENLPVGMANKLEELDEVMAKLGDWHDFAVTPKKEALIKKMMALQNSALAPDDLADKIHDLQNEWKLLCKGGQNQDEELWNAFQEAADDAFEPCRQHFSEQAEVRENNAQSRRELIAQLEQYYEAYDWEKAIWNDVEQTLRVAKDAWKTYWPVPRQEQKELQAHFDQVLDKIYQPMNAAYDVVKNRKQQLIELAKKTSENSDIAQAAEELKKLQGTWKKAGRTYRKADQALWAEFRVICDKVFEQRKALFDQANAERDAIVQKGKDAIEKLQALLDEGGKFLTTSGEKISEARNTFLSLEDLPRNQLQSFSKVSQSIDEAIAEHKRQAERGSWLQLLDISQTINDFELAPSDMLKSEIEDAIQSAKLPAGCQESLASRLENPPGKPNESAATALRLLCIRAEIATGKESPGTDRNIRMTYQVEALQKGLGSANQENIESLAKEWITHSACPADDLVTLQRRFVDMAFPAASQQKAAVSLKTTY